MGGWSLHRAHRRCEITTMRGRYGNKPKLDKWTTERFGNRMSRVHDDASAHAVYQWSPKEIPASVRRKPEDRIRIGLVASDPMYLQESVEILRDHAKETGADTEGPFFTKKKVWRWNNLRAPKYYCDAKTHFKIEEHLWWFDYYPNADGNLE